MAKNKSNEILTDKAIDKTADVVNVIAQTDPTAITTDEEVVAVVKGTIDSKETDVLVIDETPKLVIDTNAPKSFVKLADGASCWGGGQLFICNKEIKEFNLSITVLEGIRTGALIQCDKNGKAL